MDKSKEFSLMLDEAIKQHPVEFAEFDRTKNVQDQLQAMVRDGYQEHHKVIYEFSIKTPWAVNSYEKLELAYVMYKKFNKLWNAELEKWEEK